MSSRNPVVERWLRPRRNDGEDVISYALRLTEANGVGSLEQFLSEIGLRFATLGSDKGIARIAEIGRCSEDELSRDSVRPGRSGVLVRGERLLPLRYSTTGSRWFCPACFEEDRQIIETGFRFPRSWIRAWWSLEPITACHLHSHRLQSRCVCGRTVRLRHPKVATCECGMDLAKLPIVKADSTRCSAYIAGRLGFSEPVLVPLLDGLSLENAIHAIEMFGSEQLEQHADHHLRLEMGFRIIEDPDRIVRQTIAKIASRRPERGGAIQVFGEAWKFARNLPPSASRERLVGIMRGEAHRIREFDPRGRVPRNLVNRASSSRLT